MENEPERLASRLESSIYYDDQNAGKLIRNLIIQRDYDKQVMFDVLSDLERYQIKRQEFDRFHNAINSLRSRIDLDRI